MKKVTSLVLVFNITIQSVTEADNEITENDLRRRHAVVLVERLANPRFEEATDAAGALLQYGEVAVPALEKAARESSNVELRPHARRLLERITKEYPSRPKVPPFDAKILRKIEEKYGKITSHQRWTADKTYRLTGDLSIMPGGFLRIDAGTVILLPDFANIEVEERAGLEIGSTDGKRTILTTANEAEGKTGRWGWLRIRGAAKLDNVDVRHSLGVLLDSYQCHLSDVAIYATGTADSLIGFNYKNAALRCTRIGEEGKLGRITVRDAEGAGVVFDGQSVECDQIDVSGARKGVVIFKGSPSIENCHVQFARAEGLYVGWQTSPKIKNLRLNNCTIGALWRNRTAGQVESFSASKSGEVGLWIEEQSNPKIGDVTIRGSGGHGVYIRGRSFPVIDTVKATDCRLKTVEISPDSRTGL
jgi:hypothetical protein